MQKSKKPKVPEGCRLSEVVRKEGKKSTISYIVVAEYHTCAFCHKPFWPKDMKTKKILIGVEKVQVGTKRYKSGKKEPIFEEKKVYRKEPWCGKCEFENPRSMEALDKYERLLQKRGIEMPMATHKYWLYLKKKGKR